MIKLFGFASIHLRPIAEYVMLTGALCPGPSSQEDRALAARSKKKWKTRDIVKGTLIPSACSVHPGGTWEKEAAHGGKKRGEERVVPSKSTVKMMQRKMKNNLLLGPARPKRSLWGPAKVRF